MKQYTTQEFTKFFEIFNNLKPNLDNIIEEHNKIMFELEKEYGDKPYTEKNDFEFIPESEYFDMCEEEQHFIFAEEIYLGCGDYETNYGYIPFSWLTNSNWKEDFIQKQHKEFKELEEYYLLNKEKEEKIQREIEKIKLEKEKKQYELLKAKFEGEL